MLVANRKTQAIVQAIELRGRARLRTASGPAHLAAGTFVLDEGGRRRFLTLGQLEAGYVPVVLSPQPQLRLRAGRPRPPEVGA